MLNKLLQRQIKKSGINIDLYPQINELLKVISDSYDHYDSDRLLLERSIDLSSSEMIELNNKFSLESQRLKVINDRLADAQKVANLGILELDLKTFKAIASIELRRILDLQINDSDINIEDFINCIEPNDKNYVFSKIKECISNHLPFAFETNLISKKGIKKVVYIDGKIIVNSKSNTTKLIAITKDITEKTRAEKILKESEARYKSLIEQSTDLIQRIGLNGELLFVNEEWKKILGYNEHEIAKLTIFDIIAEDSLERCTEKFHRVLKGEAIKNVSAIFKTKTGNKIMVEGSVTPNIVNGKVESIQGFFRDVTERIESEEELKNKNIQLHKKSEELDKFVNIVSHDLRAPLSSMLGFVQLIEEDLTDSIAKENIGYVIKSILKMDTFIQDILDYSRNNKSQIVNQAINFEQMMSEIKNNLSYMEGSNDDVVILTDIKQFEDFYCDESRLNIIMSNLISNGIRYRNPNAENKFIEVMINANKEEAQITVTDNGIGIQSEHQEKIFDMFYRVTGKSVGNGLGLYLVKETIEKLGGTINIESQLGVGTKFIINLKNN